jgi:hypothetical protein
MDTTWKPILWRQGSLGRVIRLMDSPYYTGDRYAVFPSEDDTNECLNSEGEWEWQPMPSNRTDEFFERCRFKSFEEAVKALEK